MDMNKNERSFLQIKGEKSKDLQCPITPKHVMSETAQSITEKKHQTEDFSELDFI